MPFVIAISKTSDIKVMGCGSYKHLGLPSLDNLFDGLIKVSFDLCKDDLYSVCC